MMKCDRTSKWSSLLERSSSTTKAEQARLLLAPALLLSPPYESEDVNDDMKWWKSDASTTLSQCSPKCILMPSLPCSVINPVLNVIKTGFATLSNLLAHQALRLTETDPFAIFLESTPGKGEGTCQYALNKSANKLQRTMNIYHSPQPQQLANTVWNLSTPIICTRQMPRLPNPGLHQPFCAQRAIE